MNEYFFHDHVTPPQMDWLWANGWRHFGTYFYRYARTSHEGEVFHVIPLRIALNKFHLSRSQQRVLKRNSDLEVCFRPAFVDDDVEALFERHKVRFKDNVPESIYTFVSPQPDEVPCPCTSLCLCEKGRLVGISYLDVGEKASSSVYQCFDSAMPKRGLGIYMVLRSAQYSLSQGKSLYYHGYAYEETSHYDYKKTFNGLERYDWQTGWQPMLRSTR